MKLKREGTLRRTFPGILAGGVSGALPLTRSKHRLQVEGIDGVCRAKVDVIEKCSGHDGSWSAKTEFFPLSMKIAQKAVRQVEQVPADLVASDCPLAGLQLDQAGRRPCWRSLGAASHSNCA